MGRYDWPRGPKNRDNPAARAAHLAALRPGVDPTTLPLAVTPKRTRTTARVQPHNAPSSNQNLWVPIGPSVMTNGQATHAPNVAGRIRDLQVEPSQGQRIYAATAGGGVWYSKNGGDSWRPLDEWQISADRGRSGLISAALACGAIYVIWGPGDETTDEVWVGTGEPSLTTTGQLARRGGEPEGSQLGGQSGGIGFLHRDPTVAGGGWTVDTGPAGPDNPTPFRGASCYRITNDPSHRDQLVAATTRGLYFKAPGGGWTALTGFVAGVDVQPLDVVMTRSTDGQTLRIWVATASALRVAEVTGGGPITAGLTFQPITLTDVAVTPRPGSTQVIGTCLQLAASANRVYVLGRRNTATATNPAPAAVWSIDANAALAALAVAPLTGTPPDLFGAGPTDQSSYDMSIAVHPSTAGRIYIGGSAALIGGQWNGSIQRCDTTATSMTATPIGNGTHPDVHVLRVAPMTTPAKAAVWAGTDGGLFRSLSEGDPESFVAANDGLAVLEPGFVAGHPSNPGIVVAGFQDNGTAVRIGDGVWRQRFGGDGGGVVWDPVASNNRFIGQYIHATWQSSNGPFLAPIERNHGPAGGRARTSESDEAKASRFYSGAAAVQTAGTTGTDTHLVVGSNRIWYSRDWGTSWVTLPSATDPRAGDNPNAVQDVLDPLAGSPLHYPATVRATVSSWSSTPPPPTASRTEPAVIATRLSVVSQAPSANVVLRVLALFGGGLAWFTGSRAASATGPLAWSATTGIALQDIRDPIPGTSEETDFSAGNPLTFLPARDVVSDVYVHDPAQGTLGSCYVTTTGFPYNNGSSSTARDTLWFFDGTDEWQPTGLAIDHPNGIWTVPTDRVSAPALGVVVDPDDHSIVYVATSVGVVRGQLAVTGTTRRWTWTQFMNGLPEAVVQDLSIFTSPNLKLLRAATQARGVWEVDLRTVAAPPLSYFRVFPTDTRRLLPSPLTGPAVIGEPGNAARWDDSPDLVIDASGRARSTPPAEIELLEIPAPGLPVGAAATSVPHGIVKVYVLPHHRLSDLSLPGDQVRVALLRHALPTTGGVSLGAIWDSLKTAASQPAPPTGALPDGWTRAAADLWITRPAAELVDPRLPRALSFDVDLSADAGTDIVLLAVVMNASNQISDADLSVNGGAAATTVDQLVLSSPHVAAKTLHIS